MRAMMIAVAGALALGASVASAAIQDSAGSMCAYELSHAGEQMGHCSFNYYDKESKPLCFSNEQSLQRYLKLSRQDVKLNKDQNYAGKLNMAQQVWYQDNATSKN